MSKHLRIAAAPLLMWLGYAGTSGAATLPVPARHPSIQAAMQAASAGDTVLVAQGTYCESIQMKAGVVLKSSTGPSETILKSPPPTNPMKPNSILDVRVVDCGKGVERSTVIEGFTFEAGGVRGACIYAENASPTIRNNVIRDFGWGMHLRSSNALIEDNVITGCTPFGILIFASSPELRRNTVFDNTPQAISIVGKKSKPVIGGRREFANRIYGSDLLILNESRNDIDATWNDWGWDVAAEMERKGFPADIYEISDGSDYPPRRQGAGIVDYRHWIKSAK